MADITYSAMTAPKFRVYNRCKYDIGVKTPEGLQYNIRPNSFALLTVNDIEYIDSITSGKRFFASHMLEAVDANGKPIPLDQLQIVEASKEEQVLTDEEITAALKRPLKAMEAWVNKINDPVELYSIYKVATELDLPASKLKVLNAKMPNKDWLDELS